MTVLLASRGDPMSWAARLCRPRCRLAGIVLENRAVVPSGSRTTVDPPEVENRSAYEVVTALVIIACEGDTDCGPSLPRCLYCSLAGPLFAGCIGRQFRTQFVAEFVGARIHRGFGQGERQDIIPVPFVQLVQSGWFANLIRPGRGS